jgi:uncharacterized protein
VLFEQCTIVTFAVGATKNTSFFIQLSNFMHENIENRPEQDLSRLRQISPPVSDPVSSTLTTGQLLSQNLKYLGAGALMGIIFIKAEILSWFRIQEMFRLASFHMFGVIGTAVAVGALSVFLIKRFGVKTLSGQPISIPNKTFDRGHIYGGLIFGIGWAMTGACPGPLYAQIGTGAVAIVVTLLSAIVGTWTYGYFKDRLPH